MKLIAIMPCRNEEWVLGLTARAVLMWCDALVIREHGSTDATRSILVDLQKEYGCRVLIGSDDETIWEEMRHRHTLLIWARSIEATHVAYVDADEILTGNLLPTIRGHIEALAPGQMLSLPWLQLRAQTILDCSTSKTTYEPNLFMTSGMWAHQCASTAFRDIPQAHWAARNGYDFHQREPMGVQWRQVNPCRNRAGGLLHLQFLSERRLKAKQLAYCLTEKLRWPGRKPVAEIREMYGRTVREAAAAQCSQTPAEWWSPYSHLMQHLHVDAEPWQFQQCVDILRENPGIEDGLSDFGLGIFPSK